MALTLRPYQQEAVDATLEHLSRGKHPVVSLPTGAGKGIIVAALCQAFPDKRILVATHRKELLSQNESQLLRLGAKPGEIGVYSAGLERREMHSRVVFGGIQSIYKRIDALQQAGNFALVIVDEGHACPFRKTPSMYQKLFDACPQAQRVALSATPYRMNDGLIYSSDLSSTWFDSLAYEIGMQPLIEQGYLAPLRGIRTAANMPTDGVRIKAGEFVSADLSARACETNVVQEAADELCYLGQNRQSWIVFCIDVAHTETMAKALNERGIVCGVVTERTSSDERARVIAGAKDGSIRALLNCMTLTTGLDVPRIDLVALLRPSQSKSLVVQQIGRGSRLSPNTAKEDCCVIDMGGNLLRHKPLDGLPPEKIASSAPLQAKETREREAQEEKEQKARDWQHSTRASAEEVFGATDAGAQWLTVDAVHYDALPSRTRPGVDNLLFTYRCQEPDGRTRIVKIYLCPEYTSAGGRGARWHAEQWWKRRSAAPCPAEAVAAAHLLSGLPKPTLIAVARDGGYDRVITEHFEEGAMAQEKVQQDLFCQSPIPSLVTYLAGQGVTLVLGEGDQMFWRGGKTLATPEVLSTLRTRKAELRAYLLAQQ